LSNVSNKETVDHEVPGGRRSRKILELRKHGLHDKPVALLNTAGFYDGLALQLQRMEEDGFLPVPLAELIFLADDGASALARLKESVGMR
jgi:predicted Rossmann-fold nucleotide-binding protein